MNPDYRRIHAFLGGVRRRRWLASACTAALKAAVIAAAAVTVNLFVVDGTGRWLWPLWGIAVLGAAGFYVALGAAALTLCRPPRIGDAARVVQHRRSDLRDDVVTSLEVGARMSRREEAAFSIPLAEALLSSTGDALGRSLPSQFVSWKGSGRWLLRLVVVLVPLAAYSLGGGTVPAAPVRALVDPFVYWPLSKVVFEVDPGSTRIVLGSGLPVTARISGPRRAAAALSVSAAGAVESLAMQQAGEGEFRGSIPPVRAPLRYRIEAAGSSSPWYDVDVVIPPRAGSFEGRFTHPAYTGLPERSRAFNGDLEILPGTEVDITFDVTAELSSGRLYLGDTVYDVTSRGEGRYGVSIVPAGEKSYRLELVDGEGFRDPVPPEFRVEYLPDEFPKVELIEPQGEMVLGVFLQLPVLFSCSDDFGLSSLALVHRTPAGREVREQIPIGRSGRSVQGEYLWDAAAVEAAAGSRVEVFLEVSDNDTVSGPKKARSASFFVLVPDVEEEHRKAEALLEELIEDLVDTLADELDLLSRYEEQKGESRDWENFPWEEFEKTEEMRQGLEERSRDLEESVAALMEQMGADPLSRPESFFQLERIARDLEEMELTSREPRGDVSRSIDRNNALPGEMEQKSGFMEQYTSEAVSALEQMILQAEEMQRERNMSDIRETSSRMMDLQEDIMEKLDKLGKDDQAGAEELMNALGDLENMMRDLMESLSKENELLPEEFLNSDALEELPLTDIMKGLRDIRRMLAEGDLEGARRAAQEMLKDLANLMNRLQQAAEDFREQTRQALTRLKNSTIPEMDRMIEDQKRILGETRELDEIMKRQLPETTGEERGSPPHMIPEGEQEKLESLTGEEMALSEDAANLAEEAAALKAALPFLDPEVEQDLRGASREMGAAGDALAGSSPGGAVPSERSALSLLMKARDGARQSLQNLEQMQGMRQGQGGAAMFRRPGQGQGASFQPQQGERTGGRSGVSIRNFRLPGKEEYSVPPLFRQEILKSLQEGYPEGYEDRVRDYFHRITE